jgi:hypothetical protein
MDKEKKEASKFEDIHYDIKGIEVKGLSQDVKSWGSDTTKTAKFEEFSKKIRQDKYIYESSKIIEDIIRY